MPTAEEIRAFIEQMPNRFAPEKAVGVNANIQFNLTGDNGGQWYSQIADGTCAVAEGTFENPTMTLNATADDLYKVFTGEMNPVSAFMQGKIKVAGDMGLAIKLQNMFNL